MTRKFLRGNVVRKTPEQLADMISDIASTINGDCKKTKKIAEEILEVIKPYIPQPAYNKIGKLLYEDFIECLAIEGLNKIDRNGELLVDKEVYDKMKSALSGKRIARKKIGRKVLLVTTGGRSG